MQAINSTNEYCPKHETWFGPAPCPGCRQENDANRNLIDQALALFRRLHKESGGLRHSHGQEDRATRIGRLKYRAYRRWRQRGGQLSEGQSLASQSVNWGS